MARIEQRWLERSLKSELKKIIGDLGWTKLASKAGISQSLISLILSGNREANLDHIRRIAKAAEIDPIELLLNASRQGYSEQKKHYLDVFHNVRVGEIYSSTLADEMMNNLNKGDKYWLISIDPAMEFHTKSLDEIIFEVIEKGAYVYYVFLKEDSDEKSFGLSDLRLRRQAIGLNRQFDLWQDKLKRKRPDLEEDIKDKLKFRYVSADRGGLYFAPFAKYILIEREKEDDEFENQAWLDIAYSGIREGTIEAYESRCALRLTDDAQELLKDWCHEIETENTNKPS